MLQKPEEKDSEVLRDSEDSVILEALGRSPKTRIIDFFLENRMFDFSKKEIVEEVGMSKSTLYKYWDDIKNLGLVKQTRQFGKAKLYTLNEESSVAQKLLDLEMVLMEKAAHEAENEEY